MRRWNVFPISNSLRNNALKNRRPTERGEVNSHVPRPKTEVLTIFVTFLGITELVLNHESGDDTVFHLIEVERME